MAEPPSKRARRPDSKQMWDVADHRALQAPLPPRERDDRDDRGGERREDRNRDRRYRSRSPRDSRGSGWGRDRGGRRDERETTSREGAGNSNCRGDRESRAEGGRSDGARREYRDRERGMYPAEAVPLCFRHKPNASSQDGASARERDGGRERDARERDHRERDAGRESRDRPRERSRDRARDSMRESRSTSPRREREMDSRKETKPEKDAPKQHLAEEEFTKVRTSTLPVSFKAHNAAAEQDHERMEIDGEAQSAKKGKKGNRAAKALEEDDDLIIEDSGMAAMQAMMGFGGFGTTHQQKVAGNDIYAVRKEKRTEYRQYMNRVGGFNRPLSPSRET